MVATGGRDGSVRLWSVASGALLLPPLAHDGSVLALQFNRDSTRLVAATSDGMARIWDVRTGQRVGQPLVHDQQVVAASFAPDGLRVLTASADGAARISGMRRPASRSVSRCGTTSRSAPPSSAATAPEWSPLQTTARHASGTCGPGRLCRPSTGRAPLSWPCTRVPRRSPAVGVRRRVADGGRRPGRRRLARWSSSAIRFAGRRSIARARGSRRSPGAARSSSTSPRRS